MKRLLTIVILALAITAWISPAAAQTAPCQNTSCQGLDPSATTASSGTYSCASPPAGHEVQSIRTASAPVDGDLGVIVAELRYSPWCDAYWASGYYVHADQPQGQAPSWSLDVQLTNASFTTAQKYLLTSGGSTTGAFTSMYTGPAEACADFSWSRPSGGSNYRVCTNRVRLEYMGAGAYGTVGTACATPTANPASVIWRFRVVGLPPAGLAATPNRVKQLLDGHSAIWQNTALNTPADKCVWPYYWPLVDQQLVVNNTFAGLWLDVVAYPGSAPTSGVNYTAEVRTSLGDTVVAVYAAP